MSLTDWKTILGKLGDLTTLKTTTKNTLVAAINEIKDSISIGVASSSFLPKIIDTKATISNLATEVVLVSLPVPVGTPSGIVINFCVWGRFFNSHTANVNFRLRTKLFSTGGLIILDTGNLAIAPITAGQWRRWKLEGKLVISAGTHRVLGDFEMGTATSEAAVALSSVSSNAIYLHQSVGWNFADATELQFTAQMGIALPNVTVQLEGAIFN
jgi:hypothetical protein